jgi:hypothetical protein
MKAFGINKGWFRLVVAVCAVTVCTGIAKGGTIIVRADGSGDEPTIQAALNAAVAGDEVVLEPGTYTGNGNRDIDFLGKAVTLRSTDPNDPNVVAGTVIDCQGSPENLHRGFKFVSGEDGNSVLDGLTITGGYGPVEEFPDPEPESFAEFAAGGAIFCDGASPSISRCRIINNHAPVTGGGGFPPMPVMGGIGGGICCKDSSATIAACIISGNSARVGGGISSTGSGIIIITDCTVVGNSVEGVWSSGGGISAQSCVITNCTVSENTSKDRGAGIACWSGSAEIRNCRITDNVVTGKAGEYRNGDDGGPGGDAFGGGIYLSCVPVCTAGSIKIIENCAIYGNRASGGAGGPPGCSWWCHKGPDGRGYGGGIYGEGEGQSVIRHCVLQDNVASGPSGGGSSYGGGICTSSESTLVVHSTLWDNSANYGTQLGVIADLWGSGVSVHTAVSYCDVKGGQAGTYKGAGCTLDWGDGNIDIAPELTPDGHLRAESPCINAGDPNHTAGPDEKDIDAEQRGYGGIVDIGIDEFIDSDGDGLPDWWEQRYFGDTTSAEPDGDPDGDGFDNLKEYNIGTNPLAPGTSYYVDPNGNNSWDGLAPVWDGVHGPKATIQAAIDVAEDNKGESVVLAAGTYRGNGNRDLDFKGKALTVRSTDPDNAAVVAVTIIDCQGTRTAPHRGFYFHSGEEADSVVEGLTIKNGWVWGRWAGDWDWIEGGGGIWCRNGSPTIRNCTIAGNTSYSEFGVGGGILCNGGTIIGCTISDNVSSYGGGIYCGDAVIIDCIITGNTAISEGGDGTGGGISLFGSPTITGCIITGNRSGDGYPGGGGIDGFGSNGGSISNCIIANNQTTGPGGGGIAEYNGLITNCTITGNSAWYGGGLFYCFGAITNCVISGNSARTGGGLSRCNGPITNCTIINNYARQGYGGGLDDCGGVVTNCIIWGNSPQQIYDSGLVRFCDVQDGFAGEGNIDAEPGFALAGDEHLMPGSVCIDAGTNDPCGGLPPADFEGTIRPLEGDGNGSAFADMGAYEYDPNHSRLAVSENWLHFTQDWPAPDEQIISLRNSGGQPLYWQAVEDCPWLEVLPDSGDSDGDIDQLRVVVDPNGLPPGVYTYTFVLRDANDPNISVSIVVTLPVGRVLNVPSGAYGTIQAALDAARNYDVVVVADGNYTGEWNTNLDYHGKSITVRSVNGPDNCIINCSGANYGFLFDDGESQNSVVRGFTIIGARDSGISCRQSSPVIENCVIKGTLYSGRYGAIYCEDSRVVITGCTIESNGGNGIKCYESIIEICNCNITGNTRAGISTEESYGGKLSISNCLICHNSYGGIISTSKLEVDRCIISWNTEWGSSWAAGIKISSEMPAKITNSIISNNSAMLCAGIYCPEGSVIENCIIKDNFASSKWAGITSGGGMERESIISNCIISGNTALEGYGGITSTGNLKLINCTVTGNMGLEYAGGIISIGIGDITVENCIVWDNEAPLGAQIYLSDEFGGGSKIEVAYSNVEGGPNDIYVAPWTTLDWGSGNIDADPCFALAGNYHLTPGSACIDAGTNDPCGGLPAIDIEGISRPLDGDGDGNSVADMGAYEYSSVSPVIAVSPRFLEICYRVGQNDSVRHTLHIRNAGGGMLNWQIIEDCNWIEVSPVSGISSGEIDDVVVSLEPNGLGRGLYICVLEIEDPNAANSPIAVRILLHVGELRRVPQDFATIQSAIDAAQDYDLVEISDGVYTGNGNRDLDLRGKSITVASENGPNNCTIDCGGGGIGFYLHTGETEDSIIEGLTITNGACGIYCERASMTVKNCIITGSETAITANGIFSMISNCTITGNDTGISADGTWTEVSGCNISGNSSRGIYGLGFITVTGCTISENQGGGIEGVDLDISDCTITNNSGTDGSGIYATHGVVRIVDCNISTNESSSSVGGIYIEWCTSLTIANCVIIGNTSYNNGGGISASDTSGVIRDCIIIDNRSVAGRGGGGLHWDNGQVLIDNCELVGNRNLTWFGGAIYFLSRVEGTITNCLMTGNFARMGGAFYSEFDCNTSIINCEINGNFALGSGGGIYSRSRAELVHCTISGNAAQRNGGGALCLTSKLTVNNCILWGNEAPDGNGPQLAVRGATPWVSYSNIEGGEDDVYLRDEDSGVEWGEGNIDADPCFVQAGYRDVNGTPDDVNDDFWVDGDYHLMPGSPCIDAGTDANVYNDMEGNPRPIDWPGVDNNGELDDFDMGAYEMPLPPVEIAMHCTPKKLNPKSQGKWFKAHLTLPQGYAAEDVNVNVPCILEPLGIESKYIKVHGLAQVEVGFARSDLCGAAMRFGPGEITVYGEFVWGQAFFGTDTIRLAGIDFGSLAAISQHWLENGCRKPDWCGGADVDTSGTVDFADFVDFTLLDSCCIEVF